MTNPEDVLARAKQGHFSREDLETLRRAPLTPLSAEAAAWFNYGVACEAAIDFGNGLLMQGRMLEAARFLVSVTRDEPYSQYEPLEQFREQVLDRSRAAHDFAVFCAVAAVREAGGRVEHPQDVVSEVARILVGSEFMSPPTILVVGAGPYGGVEPALTVRYGGAGDAKNYYPPGRYYDFGAAEPGYDAALIYDLDQHAHPDAVVAHIMERVQTGPAVFVVEDYIRHRQPGESFDLDGGPAFVCLNGFNEERLRRVFETLGFKPKITITDSGYIVAEVRAEWTT